jgi:hypothetical protein
MRSVFIVGLAAFLSACGGPILIKGRVVDERGSPIEKAIVQTVPPTDTAFTNTRGFFLLQRRLTQSGDAAPIEAGTYTIEVAKTGFETASATVNAEGALQLSDLVMLPRTLKTGEAAPTVTRERKLGAGDGSTPIPGSP